MVKAKQNDKVKVHYTGKLSDGKVFDSSENREPLEFTIGSGQLIPGFEKAVEGLAKGEATEVTIPAAEAYGPVNNEMVHKVERSALPAEIKPEVGMELISKQKSGQEFPVKIIEVEPETITVDANHPLAGKDLTFNIEVVEVSAA